MTPILLPNEYSTCLLIDDCKIQPLIDFVVLVKLIFLVTHGKQGEQWQHINQTQDSETGFLFYISDHSDNDWQDNAADKGDGYSQNLIPALE